MQMTSRLSVRFEATHDDMYRAVTAASHKAKRSVKSTLRKHNRIEKRELREMRQNAPDLQAV